jgi:hypothetical protein
VTIGASKPQPKSFPLQEANPKQSKSWLYRGHYLLRRIHDSPPELNNPSQFVGLFDSAKRMNCRWCIPRGRFPGSCDTTAATNKKLSRSDLLSYPTKQHNRFNPETGITCRYLIFKD